MFTVHRITNGEELCSRNKLPLGAFQVHELYLSKDTRRNWDAKPTRVSEQLLGRVEALMRVQMSAGRRECIYSNCARQASGNV